MIKVLSRQKWLKALPNQLTLFRIAVIPILLVFYPLKFETLKIFCAALFAVAACTDWLDGFIARRYNLESSLGRILDPIADKLLCTAGLVLLVGSGNIWTWIAGILLCREVAILGMRRVALQQKFEISVSTVGKFKTFFLDFAIGCLMVNKLLWGIPFAELGMIAIWIAFALSMHSAWHYLQAFFKKVNF